MASTKEYLIYITEQLSGLPDITYRQMMGEYIIYCNGKVIGGIYDDRFLLKDTRAARSLIPSPRYELPYEGAKKMIMPDADDRELLEKVIRRMEEELPEKKRIIEKR